MINPSIFCHWCFPHQILLLWRFQSISVYSSSAHFFVVIHLFYLNNQYFLVFVVYGLFKIQIKTITPDIFFYAFGLSLLHKIVLKNSIYHHICLAHFTFSHHDRSTYTFLSISPAFPLLHSVFHPSEKLFSDRCILFVIRATCFLAWHLQYLGVRRRRLSVL